MHIEVKPLFKFDFIFQFQCKWTTDNVPLHLYMHIMKI
jgi:hypothetical protein